MKRTIIITILFSLFSAISTYFLFHSMEGFKDEVKRSKIAVKEMQSQMNTIENKYKSEIEYWVRKNNSLQQKIQKTETELSNSKQKANSLQWKIKKLISPSTTLPDGKGEKVLPGVYPDKIGREDLGGVCDSLKEQVTQFIAETNRRDNLYDSEISDLKNVIQNKDSALAVCGRGFFAIKGLTDFSLAQQTALTDKLNLANQKMRRENRKTKFLSAAVFVLSGVTATLLLSK